MSYKKSNPARTNLVLLVIVLGLYILVDFILLLSFISVYVSETKGSVDAAINGAFGFCGVSMYFIAVLIYAATAFSITLWGRGVYGRKHELYSFASFFFGISGVVSAMVLPIFAGMLGSWDFLIVVAPLPMLLQMIGLFLFIKDIGGKLMGAIGVGVHAFSRMILVTFGLIALNGGSDVLELSLIGIIISFLISIAGLIILLVGFIHAFQWTSIHEPLLDEQQVQQMQMQQYQMSLQQETLEMQRDQLLLQQETAHLIREQNRSLIEAGLIEGIPGRSSARREPKFDDFDRDIEEW
ncbi:MAG: hypothetical protein ACMUHM_06815 [Thermoplasmatota archaeon]